MSEKSKQLLRRFPKHEVAVGLVFFCTDLYPRNTQKGSSVRFRHGQKAWHQCQQSSACAHGLRSTTLCDNVGGRHWTWLHARSWFLWNLVQKSTVPTIETNCWWSYCQPSEASLMKFTSFSTTIYWLIVHVKQWSCFTVRNPSHTKHCIGCIIRIGHWTDVIPGLFTSFSVVLAC